MSDFSTRFKKMRNEIGLSQEDFAKIMECSRTKITGYEKQEPDYITFFSKLNTMYNINLNWLFTGKKEIYNPKEPVNFRMEVKQAIKELIKNGELSKNDFI